jgi:hypothetical protein
MRGSLQPRGEPLGHKVTKFTDRPSSSFGIFECLPRHFLLFSRDVIIGALDVMFITVCI